MLFAKVKIVAVGLSISWVAMSVPARAGDSGFILEQKSAVCGDLKIYTSSNAFKLVQKSTGCGLIMKAPAWKVDFFNTTSKVLFETDAKKWTGESSNFLAGLISASRFSGMVEQDTKPSVTPITGLHCSEIHLVRPGKLPPNIRQNMNELRGATYYGTSELSLPGEVAFVLQRFYRIPTVKGFPVRLDIFHLTGYKKNELDTISCVKSELATSTFDVPTGYRRVAREGDVVVANKEGLLQDMSDGLGTEFGTHK